MKGHETAVGIQFCFKNTIITLCLLYGKHCYLVRFMKAYDIGPALTKGRVALRWYYFTNSKILPYIDTTAQNALCWPIPINPMPPDYPFWVLSYGTTTLYYSYFLCIQILGKLSWYKYLYLTFPFVGRNCCVQRCITDVIAIS